MPNLTVFGAQWGDEGKGKIVDYFTERADVVVRYAGGNNAGHTLVIGDDRFAVHLLPSGVAREEKVCVLADGMVIDPLALLEELDLLAKAGHPVEQQRVRIGQRAHVVLPYHRQLDGLREDGKGGIGTTRRGIGPAYEDKAARRGIRMGDLLNPTRLKRRLRDGLRHAAPQIVQQGERPAEFAELLAEQLAIAEKLEPMICDTTLFLEQQRRAGRSLLFEGAQGVLLDIDRGTYPFVTSSTTLPAGACAGAGVGPATLGQLVGVAKAYTTRVGDGPFPTELHGEQGEALRTAGQEYGATTGRPRRCGWLDLVALRYAAQVSGMQQLALTKLDVLSRCEEIKVCEAYRIGRGLIDSFPPDPEVLEVVQPVYRKMASFTPLSGTERTFDDLPEGAQKFVEMIEEELGVPVCLIGVGAARDEVVVRPT